MNLNVIAIEQNIKEKGLTEFDDCIVYRKFFNKRWLNPAIVSIKECKEWIRINSDINRNILFNPHISFHDKVISLLIFTRIYPLIKKFL